MGTATLPLLPPPFSPPQSQLHICTVSVTSPHLLFAPSPFSVHSHSSPLASRLSYRVFFFPHPIFPPHFLKLNASRKTIRALCQRLNTVCSTLYALLSSMKH